LQHNSKVNGGFSVEARDERSRRDKPSGGLRNELIDGGSVAFKKVGKGGQKKSDSEMGESVITARGGKTTGDNETERNPKVRKEESVCVGEGRNKKQIIHLDSGRGGARRSGTWKFPTKDCERNDATYMGKKK